MHDDNRDGKNNLIPVNFTTKKRVERGGTSGPAGRKPSPGKKRGSTPEGKRQKPRGDKTTKATTAKPNPYGPPGSVTLDVPLPKEIVDALERIAMSSEGPGLAPEILAAGYIIMAVREAERPRVPRGRGGQYDDHDE